MQILCNTYLKVLRKEKVLLLINIISLGFSVGLSSIGAYLLKDINFIIISIVIAIAARNIIAEIYLARNMNLKVIPNIIQEIIYALIFILLSCYLDMTVTLTLLIIFYFAYLFINRKLFMNIIIELKAIRLL